MYVCTYVCMYFGLNCLALQPEPSFTIAHLISVRILFVIQSITHFTMTQSIMYILNYLISSSKFK